MIELESFTVSLPFEGVFSAVKVRGWRAEDAKREARGAKHSAADTADEGDEGLFMGDDQR